VSATKGDDLQTNTPQGREGRAWQYAYKSVGAAALQADNLINLSSTEPGPYRQTITWTNTINGVQTDSLLVNLMPAADPWVNGLSGGNSVVSEYLDAAALLELNKKFIQYETIAYINKKYVNSFSFDQTLYREIVGNILTAVGYDLAFSDPAGGSLTTYNVTEQATYLLGPANVDIITNQLSQLVDGINFARDQILSYTYNTAGLNLYVKQIVDALCYDLIFGSNYQSIQAGLAFNVNGSKAIATGVNAAEIEDLLDSTVINVISIYTTGSHVTINFNTAQSAPYVTGSYIIVSGMNPSSYNGTWQVTGCTTSTVTFASSLTASLITLGKVVKNNLINNILANTGVASPTINQSLINNAQLISNIVRTGATPTPKFPVTSITTNGQHSASQLLLNNISFIQAEVISFITANYPTLTYNSSLFKRNVGYAVWSLIYDLMYEGNEQSIYAGLGYWNTTSDPAISYLSTLEEPIFVSALQYVDNIAQAIINNNLIGSASGTENITVIYTSNENGIVTLDFTGQPAIPFSPGQSIIVSGSSQPGFDGTYVVVGATTSSVNFVSSTTYAGVLTSAVQGAAGVLYQQSVKQYTNETYTEGAVVAKSITDNINVITNIIASTTVPVVNSSTVTVTLPASTIITKVHPTTYLASFTGAISGTTLTVSNVVGTITVGQTIIGAAVGTTITSILSNNTYSVSGSVQTVASTVMTAVDIARNARTNIETLNNNTPNGLQKIASNFVNSNFPIINNNTGNTIIISNITALFKVITDLLINGIGARVTPTYTTPTNNAIGYIDYLHAQQAIKSNIPFISAETVAWMINNPSQSGGYTSDVTNDALVLTGIKSLLEAVCFDLTYCATVTGSSGITASNLASVTSAGRFWINGISQIPGLNLSNESFNLGIEHARAIAVQVSQNAVWGPLEQGIIQTRSNAWNTTNSGPATNISNLFTIIKDVVANNTKSYYTVGASAPYTLHLPDLRLVDIPLTSTKTVINNETSIITEQTITYLITTYPGGFNYNESLCLRDLGLIIDGQVIDLLTGGTYQSVKTGKSYYKSASALKAITGNQLVPTIDAMLFAENLSLQVLNQTTATRYQNSYAQNTNTTLSTSYDATTGTPVTINGVPTPPAIATFTTNFKIIINIINNGYGAAPAPSFGDGIWTMQFTNGGYGYVDQGGNVVVGQQSQVHIIPGKILVGNNSNANAVVVSYSSAHDNGTDYDQITYRLVQPGFFNFTKSSSGGTVYGETLDFGETVSNLNITILVETGTYYEDYPIKLAANVTIAGDDFRRTILRPLDRISQSPWRNTFFYRDSVIDGLQTGVINFTSLGKGGIDYAVAAGTTATISGKTGNITITLGNNVQTLSGWIGLIFTDGSAEFAAGGTSSYDSTSSPGKAIINSISGNVMNCTVIYPFQAIITYDIGQWHLFSTINYGYHYLTDPTQPESLTNPAKNNKEMDVFLCNDANRVRLLTAQGHGGFMMVLDPTGQIKSKSPYAQEAASFSASLGTSRRFAGGQLIDGFAGRLYGTVTEINNQGQTITVTGPINSGLDIRPPQVPCAFYVAGNRYQINDVVNWVKNIDGSGTAILTLDNSTPFYLENVYNSDTSIFKNMLKSIVGAAALDTATTVSATMATSSISGNTFTIGGSITGTVQIGMYLSGTGIRSGTYITSGSGSTWTVSYGYASTVGPITVTGTLYSNYKSIVAGLSYLQPQNQLTSLGQLLVQQGISNAGYYLVVNPGAGLNLNGEFALNNNLNLISSIIINGTNAVPSNVVYPGITASSVTAHAANIIQTNISYIESEMASWVNANYNIQNVSNYSSFVTQQDAAAIVNAITYDILYGNNVSSINSATFDRATSYYYSAGSRATTNASFQGYIVGTTLHVTSAVTKIGTVGTGSIVVGQIITGLDVTPGTTITANLSGSGAGSTWTVNYSQTVASSGSTQLIVSTSSTYTLSSSTLYIAAYAHLTYVLQKLIVNFAITPSAGNESIQNVSLTSAQDASFTGTISGTTLTINSVPSGTVAVNQHIIGSGVADGTYIVSNISGSGNGSTWTVSGSSQTVGPISIKATSVGHTIKLLMDIIIGYVSSPNTYSLPVRAIPTTINGTALSSITNYTGVVSALPAAISSTITELNAGANISINIEMGGNKSMLANDFTQVNDLGYGILATNAGLTEQVSTFTYYCYTAYWAVNGAQIRSVAGSNSNGQYGLRATGSDVTELPDAVSLFYDMVQSAHVYKQGEFLDAMEPTTTKQALNVYIVNWQYIPQDISELEIDHTASGGGIVRYEVSTVTHTDVTINGKNVLNLTLSTAGNNSTASSGLEYPLYDGQIVTIRMLQNFKFANINNVQPVRPSTALQFSENLGDIYRIISYNLTEATGEIFQLGSGIAILTVDSSFNYYQLITDSLNIVQADTVASSTATIVSGSTGSSTITINSVTGTPAIGNIIGGIGFRGQKVSVATNNMDGTWTIVLSGNPSLSPVGKVYFSTRTQGATAGDTKIAVLPITNQSSVDQLNKGIYIVGWNGRTHRVVKYTANTEIATGTYSTSGSSGTTINITNLLGSLYNGQIVTGSGFNGTQYIQSFTTSLNAGITNANIILTGSPNYGTIGGVLTFGTTTNSYVTLDPNPQYNNSAIGTPVNSMTYNSWSYVPDSTSSKIFTFDIPYNATTASLNTSVLPPVDSSITIAQNTNSGYNGTYSVVGINNYTTIKTTSVSNLSPGMVVSSVQTTLNITGLTPNSPIAGSVTVAFTNPTPSVIPYETGSTVILSGISPNGYNQSYIVTLGSSGSVVFSQSSLGAWSGGGSITNPAGIVPSGAIIQSINANNLTFVVSPAIWVPAGATLSAIAEATLLSVSPYQNIGTGYTTSNPPTVVLSDLGAAPVRQAQVVATVNSNGSLTLSIIDPGYGYTSAPTVTITGGYGSIGATTISSTLTSAPSAAPVVTDGSSLVQMKLLYNTDPGTSGVVTQVTALGDYITVSNATSLIVGNAINFTGGNVLGNISTTTTYYILTIASPLITVSIYPPPGHPLYTGHAQDMFVPINSSSATGNMNYYSASYGLGTPILATSFGSATVIGATTQYAVVLNFDSTTQPTIGAYYHVLGNSNNLYNGYFISSNSSTTSITLTYPYNPGIYNNSSGSTTITKEITHGSSNTLGISKPFITTGSTTLRAGYAVNTGGQITVRISTCRATGHDFLDIGTGGFDTTNYPNQIYGNPAIPVNPSKQVIEEGVGRVFYVSTDENGIFKVGRFFQVDQGTGTVTFSASIALSNLNGLGFKRGVVVTQFSTDETMTENNPDIVPVQSAIRGFVDLRLGLDYGGNPVPNNQLIGYGYMSLGGGLAMKANMNLGNNSINNLVMPNNNVSPYDAANRQYVDTSIGSTSSMFKLQDVATAATATYINLSGNTLTVTNVAGTLIKGQTVTSAATSTAGTISNGAGSAGFGFVAGGTITGTFAIGMLLTGSGITSGTFINGGSAGANGGGNFTVDNPGHSSQRVTSEIITGDYFSSQTITDVTFDDLTGYTVITLSGSPSSSIIGQPTIKFTNLVDGNFLVYDNASSQWKNLPAPTGDVNINYAGTNDVNGTLTTSIQTGVIVNAQVNSSAGIVQSKLALNIAKTLASTTNGSGGGGAIVQADLGVAVFKSNLFTVTNGFVDLFTSTNTTSGILLGKIQQISTGYVLGNLSGNTASPSAITTANVISSGGGVLTSSFTGAGVLTQTGQGTGFSVTAVGTTYGSDRIVKSGSTGIVDVSSLAIKSNNVITLNSDGVTLQFNTPSTGGQANPSFFMTAVGGASDGGTTSVVVTVNGTLAVPGSMQVTTIKTASSDPTVAGTVTGNWKVQSSSNWDVTAGSLYSTTLNAGPSTSNTATQGSTQATITGKWSLANGSSLNFPSGSTLDATNGSLKSKSLNAGTASDTGTITGVWTVNGGITLYDSNTTLDATLGKLKSTTLNAGSGTTAGTMTGVWTYANDGNSSIAAKTALIATSSGKSTNVAGGDTNKIPYQTAADATSFIVAPSVDSTFLKWNTSGGFSWGNPSVTTVSSGGTVTTSSVTTSQIIANGVGNPATGTISGVWSLTGTGSQLQATYADLAEFYSSDSEYEPGTVLVFGGDAEVTTTVTINDTRCAGVVTTDPAYTMNSELSGTRACLALAGRVPCKVVGRVKKGDILTTSATPGYAVRASTPTLGAIVGKALQDKDYGEAGVIEIAVGRA
jgi:hypothetical protein